MAVDVVTEETLNGVGALLARVVEEKVEESAAKRRVFDRLHLTVAAQVVDVGQLAAVEFDRGSTRVSCGWPPKPDLAVICDHDTFVELLTLRLAPGDVPNLFDATGRSLVRKLATRRLVLRGALRHPVGFLRFLRFVAVED
jgi:hypothetical protein